HLAAPVAQARGRRLGEVAVLGHVRRVARARVVEQRVFPWQRGVLADESQISLRLFDQILVAELHVAAAGAPAELPCGEDLRPPPGRDLGDGAGQRPRLAGEALRQLEEGRRGVAPVAYEMPPDRIRERALEQGQLLHVEGCFVAPAWFPLP